MFRRLDALAAVVDEVVVAPTAEAIVEARRIRDALDARIAAAEVEYSSRRDFELDGHATMASFLRHRCAMTVAESNRVAGRTKKLARWPDVLDAWTAGRLSGTQVDVMAAKVPDRHVERFAITAPDTVSILEPLTTWQTQKALTHWATLADDAAQREAVEDGRQPCEMVPERELSTSRTIDDRLELSGSFDRDSAAAIEDALRAAARPDADGETRTPKQRRADALVEVCRFYLSHHQQHPNAARPDRGIVVFDPTTMFRAILRGDGVHTAHQLERYLDSQPELGAAERGLFLDAFDSHTGTATTLDGHSVTDALVRHVMIDGILERLLKTDSRIIDHGRSTRIYTDSQKRAMAVRDGGSRISGDPPWDCHAHHSPEWDEGGTTDINTGYLKTTREHLDHHRRGVTDHINPDGSITLTTPDGTDHHLRPPVWTDTLPTLPVHTTSQPAPVMPFALDERPIGRAHGDEQPSSDGPSTEVAEADLIVETVVINGLDWVIVAETAEEFIATIALTRAA